MRNVMTRSHVGHDGVLKLEIPTEHSDKDIEVLVVYQMIDESDVKLSSEAMGWSPGFFEHIIGGWQGVPFLREPQGDFEVREELI